MDKSVDMGKGGEGVGLRGARVQLWLGSGKSGPDVRTMSKYGRTEGWHDTPQSAQLAFPAFSSACANLLKEPANDRLLRK
jgi:hypothetical protein